MLEQHKLQLHRGNRCRNDTYYIFIEEIVAGLVQIISLQGDESMHTHCRMFPNQFAAHYTAENNIITKYLLLFFK